MESCALSVLDRPAAELTVVDVYDIAAVLGHEFERVIDRFGCESMVGVVPKVVRVLELLETLVNYGGGGHKAEELQGELDRLRQERSDRYEQEKKHQMELELLEDVWRGEVQDLLSQTTQLQAENKKLLLSLSLTESPVTVDDLQRQEGMSEKEKQVMEKLKELVKKQRDEIQAKEHELTLKNADVEALQLQQNRLIKINQDLRHRLSLMKAQGKALVQQRVELEAAAHARQQELGALRLEVSRLRRELQDLELDREVAQVQHLSSSVPKSGTSPARSPQTQASAEPDAVVEPSSVWAECAGDPAFRENCFEQDSSEGKDTALLLPVSGSACSESEEDEAGQESDTPHFTLQELRDVLQEKNELKAQVFLLQEELAYYKTEDFEEDCSSCVCPLSPEESPAPVDLPESGIRRLIFTAIMPMVAAGLISDDPTLMPIRRLVSFV